MGNEKSGVKKQYQNSDFPARHNLDARWALIEAALPRQPSWFLDVGANNGDTQKRLTSLGHYSLGIEVDPAAANRDLPAGAAMMVASVTPQMLEHMPKFTGVFMLSVFHRMWDLHGESFATEVLTRAIQKSEFLIFEGCSRHARYLTQRRSKAPPFSDLNEVESIRWHTDLLSQIVPSSAVKFIGITKTVKTFDPRPLFYVKKDE